MNDERNRGWWCCGAEYGTHGLGCVNFPIWAAAELERLREENKRYMTALSCIAGELGEFADADGETMVWKIRFLREEYEGVDKVNEQLREENEKYNAAAEDDAVALASLREWVETYKEAVEWACSELEKESCARIDLSENSVVRKVQEGIGKIIRERLSNFAAELRHRAGKEVK